MLRPHLPQDAWVLIHPYRPGRNPSWQCLLGAFLPGTWHSGIPIIFPKCSDKFQKESKLDYKKGPHEELTIHNQEITRRKIVIVCSRSTWRIMLCWNLWQCPSIGESWFFKVFWLWNSSVQERLSIFLQTVNTDLIMRHASRCSLMLSGANGCFWMLEILDQKC